MKTASMYAMCMTTEHKPEPFYWQVVVTQSDGEVRTYCYLSYEVAKQAYRVMLDRGANTKLKRSDQK